MKTCQHCHEEYTGRRYRYCSLACAQDQRRAYLRRYQRQYARRKQARPAKATQRQRLQRVMEKHGWKREG